MCLVVFSGCSPVILGRLLTTRWLYDLWYLRAVVSKCGVDSVMSLWAGLLTAVSSVVGVCVSMITVLLDWRWLVPHCPGAQVKWSPVRLRKAMTVWYYKPVSLNEGLSRLFYVDALRDKFRPVSITPFLPLPEKLWPERSSCPSKPIYPYLAGFFLKVGNSWPANWRVLFTKLVFQIRGNTHGCCGGAVREKQASLSCSHHNFLKLASNYLLKSPTTAQLCLPSTE